MSSSVRFVTAARQRRLASRAMANRKSTKQGAPADPASGNVPVRIRLRDIPVRLRIERILIIVCYLVGVYFTLGGFRSLLGLAQWEILKFLLLPAIAVLVGTRVWHANHHARALDHLRRRQASQPPR